MDALAAYEVNLLGTQTGTSTRSRWRSPKIMVLMAGVIAIALVLVAVSLYLGSGLTYPGPALPRVDGLSFGSNGWVTFHITNPMSVSISFYSINASEISGTNVTYLATVPVSTLKVVPAGGTLSLAVQFQNLTWQSGVKYWFELASNYGNIRIDATGCINGC